MNHEESPDTEIEPVVACRYCAEATGQVKAGLNRSGTHRYRCAHCLRHYTPAPKAQGYPDDIRRQAIALHTQGASLRRIGTLLRVNHQSVVNWIRQSEASAKPAPIELPAPALAISSRTSPAAQPSDPRTIAKLINGPETAPALTTGAKNRATIEDVARRAGVAASTVSNLLNDKGRMSPETRRRVRAAMDDLHFTPNALVRAIRSRRTRILGVLIFDLDRIDKDVDHALTIPLLGGIYRAADAASYDVLLYTGWPGRPERNTGLDFLNGHVDGLLWAVPPIGTPALERVAAAGLPVVTMLSRHVPDGVGYVNGDNIDAGKQLVAHLAARGHRRIAFAGPARKSSNYEDRRAGYRDGLKIAGLTYDPALEANSADTRRVGDTVARLIDGWLGLPDRPTAIIAVTDEWAEAACAALDALGLHVPSDIAVTGFDDVPAARALCEGGGLTTIHQHFPEIGSRAVERLIAMIEGASVDECRLTIPANLVIRASTGGGPSFQP